MLGVPSFMLSVGADSVMVTLGTDTGLCFVSGLASAEQCHGHQLSCLLSAVMSCSCLTSAQHTTSTEIFIKIVKSHAFYNTVVEV